jgi:enoyl-CoA hydratase
MIRSERRGAVTHVTLDRQERRNAIDAVGCRDLETAVADAIATGSRVVVLTGAGGHFCAGADLQQVEDTAFVEALRGALLALHDAAVPVIAAVDGAALGAGTQLAIACDLRVATPAARFGIPAAKLGLMVDHWTVRRLARLAGHGPARSMLLAAEVVDGSTASALGLVQRLGGLDDALAWADTIATLAPLTIAGHKLMLNRGDGGAGGDDPEVAEAFARAWRSSDLAEGMVAFRERRPPRFTGA